MPGPFPCSLPAGSGIHWFRDSSGSRYWRGCGPYARSCPTPARAERFDTPDHRPRRVDFGGTMCRSRFHIHDHTVLGIDLVVSGIGKVSRTTWRCCPTRQRGGE